jgi:hypothetical protein
LGVLGANCLDLHLFAYCHELYYFGPLSYELCDIYSNGGAVGG